MTSRAKWGYKGNDKVLRPWIAHLLIKQALKQKAQKVQVLQNACGSQPDGSLVKELTDGQVYIKAVFTAGALNIYHSDLEDDSCPPNIDDALLILQDYDVKFMPHPIQNQCEFVILVNKFTVWSYQEGFSRKTSPSNSMDDADVRKRIYNEWLQWVERNEVNNPQEDTMDSVPLSQLLEEMGKADSPEMEEGNAPMENPEIITVEKPKEGPKDSVSQNHGRSTGKRLFLCKNICVENFIISPGDETLLAALEEWQHDYERPPSPHSVNGSSRNTPTVWSESCVNTLRRQIVTSAARLEKTYCKNKGIGQDREKNHNKCSGREAGVEGTQNDRDETNLAAHPTSKDPRQHCDLVDVGVQVSQSLLDNYVAHRKQRTQDTAMQTSQHSKHGQLEGQSLEANPDRQNWDDQGSRTSEDDPYITAESEMGGRTLCSPQSTNRSPVAATFSACFENFVMENYGESIRLSCSPNKHSEENKEETDDGSERSFVTCDKSPRVHSPETDDHFQSTQVSVEMSRHTLSGDITHPNFDLSPVQKQSSPHVNKNVDLASTSSKDIDLVIVHDSSSEDEKEVTNDNQEDEDASRTIVDESIEILSDSENEAVENYDTDLNRSRCLRKGILNASYRSKLRSGSTVKSADRSELLRLSKFRLSKSNVSHSTEKSKTSPQSTRVTHSSYVPVQLLRRPLRLSGSMISSRNEGESTSSKSAPISGKSSPSAAAKSIRSPNVTTTSKKLLDAAAKDSHTPKSPRASNDVGSSGVTEDQNRRSQHDPSSNKTPIRITPGQNKDSTPKSLSPVRSWEITSGAREALNINTPSRVLMTRIHASAELSQKTTVNIDRSPHTMVDIEENPMKTTRNAQSKERSSKQVTESSSSVVPCRMWASITARGRAGLSFPQSSDEETVDLTASDSRSPITAPPMVKSTTPTRTDTRSNETEGQTEGSRTNKNSTMTTSKGHFDVPVSRLVASHSPNSTGHRSGIPPSPHTGGASRGSFKRKKIASDSDDNDVPSEKHHLSGKKRRRTESAKSGSSGQESELSDHGQSHNHSFVQKVMSTISGLVRFGKKDSSESMANKSPRRKSQQLKAGRKFKNEDVVAVHDVEYLSCSSDDNHDNGDTKWKHSADESNLNESALHPSHDVLRSSNEKDSGSTVLNDAQVISSEEVTDNRIAMDMPTTSPDVEEEMAPIAGEENCVSFQSVSTPANSLPSYQPRLPIQDLSLIRPSAGAAVRKPKKSLWSLLEESTPVSPLGHALLDITFPDRLMMKINSCLMRK